MAHPQKSSLSDPYGRTCLFGSPEPIKHSFEPPLNLVAQAALDRSPGVDGDAWFSEGATEPGGQHDTVPFTRVAGEVGARLRRELLDSDRSSVPSSASFSSARGAG